MLPGNVPARGGHLTCFAGDGCERRTANLADWQNMAGVDLGGFWWYQKQAGLAGISSKLWRAPRPDRIGAFRVKVEFAPDHSIVAGFLSTRIVLTGISSARRLVKDDLGRSVFGCTRAVG